MLKNIFNVYKAYSSVVERAAHNGFVVGSNPTRPMIYYKKLIFLCILL